MPTYEYLCDTCNHRFELWQKMADEPLTTCPQCNATIHRVVYASGIVFKGGGFYKTDQSIKAPVTTETASEKKETETSKAESTTNSDTKTTPAESTKTTTESKPAGTATPSATTNTAKETPKPEPAKQPAIP